MSAKNKAQSQSDATQNGFTDSIRDFVGLQCRTTQFMMDKTLGLSQSVTELCQNHINESMKLAQEYAKYGWGLTESMKKTTSEMAEKSFRNLNS